jgi:hypothetical protein
LRRSLSVSLSWSFKHLRKKHTLIRLVCWKQNKKKEVHLYQPGASNSYNEIKERFKSGSLSRRSILHLWNDTSSIWFRLHI